MSDGPRERRYVGTRRWLDFVRYARLLAFARDAHTAAAIFDQAIHHPEIYHRFGRDRARRTELEAAPEQYVTDRDEVLAVYSAHIAFVRGIPTCSQSCSSPASTETLPKAEGFLTGFEVGRRSHCGLYPRPKIRHKLLGLSGRRRRISMLIAEHPLTVPPACSKETLTCR